MSTDKLVVEEQRYSNPSNPLYQTGFDQRHKQVFLIGRPQDKVSELVG